jgi:hypothetical protein
VTQATSNNAESPAIAKVVPRVSSVVRKTLQPTVAISTESVAKGGPPQAEVVFQIPAIVHSERELPPVQKVEPSYRSVDKKPALLSAAKVLSALAADPIAASPANTPNDTVPREVTQSLAEIATTLKILLTYHERAASAPAAQTPVAITATTEPTSSSPTQSTPSIRTPTEFEWALEHEAVDGELQLLYEKWCVHIHQHTLGCALPIVAVAKSGAIRNTAGHIARLAMRWAAEKGRPVLLLDAAVHESELTVAFEQLHSPGWIDLFVQQRLLRDSVQSLTLHELAFVPRGQLTLSEPIIDLQLTDELPRLADRFAGIICDVGSLSHPYSMACAKMADAAYLLVELGRTPQQLAVDCVNRFKRQGGTFQQCIVLGEDT